jgi:hypothetical protein
MSKTVIEKIADAATHAPDKLMDARAIGGGIVAGVTLADIQMWSAIVGLLVGISTLVYVVLGIYGRVQKIRKGGVDES